MSNSAQNLDEPAGVSTCSGSGVDLSLSRENLKLIVTERWERHAQVLELEIVQAFREAGRVRREETARTQEARQQATRFDVSTRGGTQFPGGDVHQFPQQFE